MTEGRAGSPNSPLCHSQHCQSPSVIPNIVNLPPSFPTLSIPLRHSQHCQSPSVIPDIVNLPPSFPTLSIPLCHPRCCQFPSVIPTFPPSVIPDIFNRESMVFPKQCRPNEETKEKDTGFPLKTCGNDRRESRAARFPPTVIPVCRSVRTFYPFRHLFSSGKDGSPPTFHTWESQT